ncbi:MAG: hypothetical protein QNI91_08915 [Arenicellales bacterium]|nr:hypothetical protein [Arenicellales bacterium]
MGTFKGTLAVMTTLFPLSAALYGDELIYYQDWVKVKNATTLLQLPALQRVVNEFEKKEQSKIVIRHPGGDGGNEWAIELRDWLVALGISTEEIQLQPGSGVPQAIAITTEVSELP